MISEASTLLEPWGRSTSAPVATALASVQQPERQEGAGELNRALKTPEVLHTAMGGWDACTDEQITLDVDLIFGEADRATDCGDSS